MLTRLSTAATASATAGSSVLASSAAGSTSRDRRPPRVRVDIERLASSAYSTALIASFSACRSMSPSLLRREKSIASSVCSWSFTFAVSRRAIAPATDARRELRARAAPDTERSLGTRASGSSGFMSSASDSSARWKEARAATPSVRAHCPSLTAVPDSTRRSAILSISRELGARRWNASAALAVVASASMVADRVARTPIIACRASSSASCSRATETFLAATP
mmetsp:Transcript_18016/g.63687  ORF Transcript_18016/g.63687 Transcript_18016/m.63687 type:complete len:224 (-) Transcript_18016:1355-2026(-)